VPSPLSAAEERSPGVRPSSAQRQREPAAASLHSQIFRGLLAAVVEDVIGDLVTFAKVVQAGTLDRRDVDEHVLAAVVRPDEAVALFSVEKFHSPARHVCSPLVTAVALGSEWFLAGPRSRAIFFRSSALPVLSNLPNSSRSSAVRLPTASGAFRGGKGRVGQNQAITRQRITRALQPQGYRAARLEKEQRTRRA